VTGRNVWPRSFEQGEEHCPAYAAGVTDRDEKKPRVGAMMIYLDNHVNAFFIFQGRTPNTSMRFSDSSN
jgi:hypothetical protein